MVRFILALGILIAFGTSNSFAQSSNDSIIFTHSGRFFAQSVGIGTLTQISPLTEPIGYDIYDRVQVPSEFNLSDELGFWHGVWSPDRTQFAYLELSPPQYRIRLGDNILFEAEQNLARGYLDPIAWQDNNTLILLERQLLNHIFRIRTWQLDVITGDMNLQTTIPTERLSGRSAILADGKTVFVGFNIAQDIGYVFDVITAQASIFQSNLTSMNFSPPKGFEYFPLQVLGGLSDNQLPNSIEYTPLETVAITTPIAPPFLYWSLPDDQRQITCYPDSPWTAANFDVICPGASRRQYTGHQGTDTGGNPSGLPIGTPVYPATIGTVVATFTECGDNNPSCNNAYGNTVTLEHVIIQNGDIQVWYTGYGHLSAVLVNIGDSLTDLTQPLGFSGATGIGGPHLHFEVRTPDGWVDPWDNRTQESLWIGGNVRPIALNGVILEDMSEAIICTSPNGNNIRSGPGTTHNIIATTSQGVNYAVQETTFVQEGTAIGDWYRVSFNGVEGWLWSGLLDCNAN